MARLFSLCCLSLLVVVLLVDVAVSRDLSEISPVPAPAPSTDADSPTSSHPPSINDAAPASAPSSVQSPSPLSNSPPAPPSEDAPASSPTEEDSPVPSPSSPSSPSPSPADASDINHASNQNDNDEAKSSSGGSSKGHKAGIVVGVLGAAVVVGLGGLIYKKRRDNIRRSSYGQAARRELL